MEFGLVALWLLLYLAVLYLGGTLAAVVFPRFADRGLGVAIPLGLAVLWLVTYVAGHVSLGLGTWLGVVVLVGLAWVAKGRGASVGRRLYAETAAVFSAAFLLLVAVRAVDPAIVPLGGEKFLDFGLVKSILRADSLPPEDMWFAGEPVAYYYGGHLLAATLTRITGTAGRFAYNLALAGFYATLVTAVYGLAGSVGAERGLSRRRAGAFGAFLVGVASNLLTPGRVTLWLLPDPMAAWIAGRLGVELSGVATEGPAAFHYWDASRVIQDDPADFATFEPAIAPVIDEFPFFAWLNGDLHAHMMSTGFLVLVAAVCFAYYLTPAGEVRRRRALLVGVLPPLAGLLAVTNTWSFPSVGGLAMLTVALAPADPRTLLPAPASSALSGGPVRRELSRFGVGLAVAGVVLALGLVWSLPFWLGAASGREIAVLPDRTSLGELLLVHGTLLLPIGGYLYLRAADALTPDRARVGALLAVAAVGLAASVDLAAVGLFVPVVLTAWVLLRGPVLGDGAAVEPVSSDGGEASDASRASSERGSDGGLGFEGVLVIGGMGLVTIVEFVFVAENVGRMNTVFKTYMQVWVLWAIAAGVALAAVASRWSPAPGRWRPLAARGFAVLLLVSASLYAGLALSAHFGSQSDIARTDDPTLDGRAWIDVRHPDEAPAIRWLDEREGRPTIVTAAPAGYRWNPSEGKGASAPASLTGLPTVAGWHHEGQYRGDDVYQERVTDVETIYGGDPAEQARLLSEYDVEYVYVGPAERARYDDVTVGELDGVTVAEEWSGVTIYRVDGEAVSSS
ncbi:DUF2298 domain-containing protein [Halomicrobium salinisoli]|uniref:DUF2298 domain-containing protein n=1 Tax=Halomicrobium salinisoli TaxID=2878391 RepID=UPI001CF07ECF|nr:DUF2298 domain-containing protein [Halomicrobium salinisoli]